MSTTTLRQKSEHPVPRAVLRAAGIMVALALLSVGAARLTGTPPAALPPASTEAAARDIVILRTEAGGVRVSDAESGAEIAALDLEAAGFIGGVARVLDRERGRAGLALDLPVRLVRWQDGRLSLHDPATGWRAELIGFGRDNEAAFARLLGE